MFCCMQLRVLKLCITAAESGHPRAGSSTLAAQIVESHATASAPKGRELRQLEKDAAASLLELYSQTDAEEGHREKAVDLQRDSMLARAAGAQSADGATGDADRHS